MKLTFCRSAASAVGSSFEAHDADDAGAGGVESAKLQELENVVTDVTGTLKDTTSVLSKRLDEGKVTLSAVRDTALRGPCRGVLLAQYTSALLRSCKHRRSRPPLHLRRSWLRNERAALMGAAQEMNALCSVSYPQGALPACA